MPEQPNKNLDQNFNDDIIVKQPDGSFKVLVQGQWQDLKAYRPQAARVVPPALSQEEEINLGQLNQEITRAANLSLPEELKSRLQNIVRAHLRGVRNKLDTSLVLQRKTTEGGLGLTEEQAQEILEIIEKKKIGLEEKQVDPKIKEDKPVLDLSHELAPPPPVVVFDSQVPNKGLATLIPKKQAVPSREEGELKQIKFKPQLVGPVEEIRNLTLLDFRRLDKEPGQATQKIKDKIELLGEHSFEEKQKGLRAWRQSGLNKHYLELGELAIREGRSVAELIKTKQAKNEPSLTMEEFKALLELNKELKY